MILTLQTHGHRTLEEVRRFLSGNETVDFVLSDRVSAYSFIVETLVKFRYRALPRRDKGSIRSYLMKMTGKSESQVTRLIRQYLETGRIRDRRGAVDHAFRRQYTKADIGLLAEVDEALGQLCGHATRAVMRRMHEEYGDERFERLAGISSGQFYNLRNSTTYRRRRTTFRETRATGVSIGERRKPRPKGRPGFLRVDTVHQGDKDGEKGVYHVNLVDEVTQWEHVATVRAISHGNVIRRHFGYGHIPKPFAPEVNAFARDTLSPFLNSHRPCLFSSEVTDTKGKTRKRYRYKDVMTPFEKLRSLPKVEHYLKPGVTIAALEDQAGAMSDLEAAV